MSIHMKSYVQMRLLFPIIYFLLNVYKTNYRPVSLLPSVSKIFERLISSNINYYIDIFLSRRLCTFRRNYGI